MTAKLCGSHEEAWIQLLSDFTVHPGAAKSASLMQATIAFGWDLALAKLW